MSSAAKNTTVSCWFSEQLLLIFWLLALTRPEGETVKHKALFLLSSFFKSSELFETIPVEVSGKTFLLSVQD